VGAIALAAGASGATAQTATLIGMVMRDSSNHELAGAEITLPDLKLNRTANYLGEFRFNGLPAGRHAIVIRHVGFAPLYDTVDLKAGARVEREFILEQQATQLDSVRVTAPEKKHVSPGLQQFEERRAQDFGHFITTDELRKNDNRNLLDVITGSVPGVTRFHVTKTNADYISSGRKCGNGPSILGCKPGETQCPPAMYLDGAMYYNPTDGDPAQIPDLRRLPVREIGAIEFYAGAATIPAQYNRTLNGCGVLLVWSRDR
jgi:hypothetical protein